MKISYECIRRLARGSKARLDSGNNPHKAKRGLSFTNLRQRHNPSRLTTSFVMALSKARKAPYRHVSFLNERKGIYAFYQREERAYHQQRCLYNEKNRQQLLREILDLIEQNLHNYDLCFDVGCAEGLLTRKVTTIREFRICVGLDISLPKLSRASEESRKTLNTSFIQADAEYLPLLKQIADLVLCIETLEHVSDHKKALLEIQRVLKNGGILILSVPYDYVDADYFKLARKAILNLKSSRDVAPFSRGGRGHLHEFSPVLVFSLLRKNGFAIISHQHAKANRKIIEEILSFVKLRELSSKSKWILVIARKTNIANV